MTPGRIVYVMEQTLGNVTHYLNLRREEAQAGAGKPLWLPIEYRPSRVPWAIAGSRDARRALAQVAGEIDGIFVHTTTLALFAADFCRKNPTVLSSDGPPITPAMRAAYGLRPQSRFVERAKRLVYRRLFRLAAGMVAFSDWAKASMVDDYGCRERDVTVIAPGVDLDRFAPGVRGNALPRILFVGGDFQRKGGQLLIDTYRRRLRGRAELVLVTPADVPPEPGIEVHRDLKVNSPELRALYASCDLFALPTHADTYSLVCIEALASGLPVVTTRVGGIPELVREGVTGHLVECGDGDGLGDALESLVMQGARRRAMSAACRAEAVARFDVRVNARRLFELVQARCGGPAQLGP